MDHNEHETEPDPFEDLFNTGNDGDSLFGRPIYAGGSVRYVSETQRSLVQTGHVNAPASETQARPVDPLSAPRTRSDLLISNDNAFETNQDSIDVVTINQPRNANTTELTKPAPPPRANLYAKLGQPRSSVADVESGLALPLRLTKNFRIAAKAWILDQSFPERQQICGRRNLEFGSPSEKALEQTRNYLQTGAGEDYWGESASYAARLTLSWPADSASIAERVGGLLRYLNQIYRGSVAFKAANNKRKAAQLTEDVTLVAHQPAILSPQLAEEPSVVALQQTDEFPQQAVQPFQQAFQSPQHSIQSAQQSILFGQQRTQSQWRAIYLRTAQWVQQVRLDTQAGSLEARPLIEASSSVSLPDEPEGHPDVHCKVTVIHRSGQLSSFDAVVTDRFELHAAVAGHLWNLTGRYEALRDLKIIKNQFLIVFDGDMKVFSCDGQ